MSLRGLPFSGEFNPMGVLVGDVDPKVPTNNLVVFGFCELWGILLGLPPGEDLYHGEPLTARMIIFLALGSAFVILGPSWPWIKSSFPRRISVTFVRAATDFRWWAVMLLVGLILPSILQRGSLNKSSEVIGHIKDTDTGEVLSGPAPSPSLQASTKESAEAQAHIRNLEQKLEDAR